MFREKRPTTLSHSVPSLGSKSSLLAIALARWPTRCFTSETEKDLPERPQMNGFLDSLKGSRPYFSVRMNSSSVMESGASRERLVSGVQLDALRATAHRRAAWEPMPAM